MNWINQLFTFGIALSAVQNTTFGGDEHRSENLNFFSVLWTNLLTNLQLQAIVLFLIFLIVCCCCCCWGAFFFFGWRYGIWKRIITRLFGTIKDAEKGRISYKKMNYKKSKRNHDKFLEKLARNQDICYIVIDDDESFDWACSKEILLYDVTDTVCYCGYLTIDKEKYYFHIDPPLQRWKFTRERWKRVKKNNNLPLDRVRIRSSYCKWINIEPIGEILNAKSLHR